MNGWMDGSIGPFAHTSPLCFGPEQIWDPSAGAVSRRDCLQRKRPIVPSVFESPHGRNGRMTQTTADATGAPEGLNNTRLHGHGYTTFAQRVSRILGLKSSDDLLKHWDFEPAEVDRRNRSVDSVASCDQRRGAKQWNRNEMNRGASSRTKTNSSACTVLIPAPKTTSKSPLSILFSFKHLAPSAASFFLVPHSHNSICTLLSRSSIELPVR